MLIRRPTFNHKKPGQCITLYSAKLQDTDFAMAVRAAGYKVLLQPVSVVYHQEGGTFGTDANSDIKRRLMLENGQKFKKKWDTVLKVPTVIALRHNKHNRPSKVVCENGKRSSSFDAI